jgi:hypothetical protein
MPEDPNAAARAMVDIYLNFLVQTLALRLALVDRGILTDAEINSWCNKVKELPATQKAALTFAALDVEAVLSLLKPEGPVQ